ncbi:MAG: SDR family oxidoreductase, partial [Thermomonas sp.]
AAVARQQTRRGQLQWLALDGALAAALRGSGEVDAVVLDVAGDMFATSRTIPALLAATPMKRFDLMQQVNSRGSFVCAQACLPHLLNAPNPHILTLCPPPSLDPKWWGPHTAYTLAKMGMSFVTLGLAAEFGPRGLAVNALWPRTLIATDALNMIPGVQAGNGRSPAIMADAAHAVLVRPAAGFSGRFLIDEDVLREAGVADFSGYAVDPSLPLLPDLYVEP